MNARDTRYLTLLAREYPSPQAASADATPAAPATFRKFLREIFMRISSIFLRVFCYGGAVAPCMVRTLLLLLLYRFFSKTKWKMSVFLLEKTDIQKQPVQ